MAGKANRPSIEIFKHRNYNKLNITSFFFNGRNFQLFTLLAINRTVSGKPIYWTPKALSFYSNYSLRTIRQFLSQFRQAFPEKLILIYKFRERSITTPTLRLGNSKNFSLKKSVKSYHLTTPEFDILLSPKSKACNYSPLEVKVTFEDSFRYKHELVTLFRFLKLRSLSMVLSILKPGEILDVNVISERLEKKGVKFQKYSFIRSIDLILNDKNLKASFIPVFIFTTMDLENLKGKFKIISHSKSRQRYFFSMRFSKIVISTSKDKLISKVELNEYKKLAVAIFPSKQDVKDRDELVSNLFY